MEPFADDRPLSPSAMAMACPAGVVIGRTKGAVEDLLHEANGRTPFSLAGTGITLTLMRPDPSNGGLADTQTSAAGLCKNYIYSVLQGTPYRIYGREG